MPRAGVIPIIVSSSAVEPATIQGSGHHIIHSIRRGVALRSLCRRVLILGLLGCRWAQRAAYGCILVATMLTRKCPGMVAMAVRQIFVISEDGGRPYCQSRPCMTSTLKTFTRYFKQNQYTDMLSLQVVGPGGSLSMLLLLRHSGASWRVS
jgi:hypothetical protein